MRTLRGPMDAARMSKRAKLIRSESDGSDDDAPAAVVKAPRSAIPLGRSDEDESDEGSENEDEDGGVANGDDDGDDDANPAGFSQDELQTRKAVLDSENDFAVDATSAIRLAFGELLCCSVVMHCS